ncbi:MAG: restriction endonuclease subunit S [Candidatus Omnitrophota bacterium]
MAGKWPIVKVGKLADSISETHQLNKDRLIFLNTSDILLGKILHRTYTRVQDWPGQAKKSIRRDDILFSEIRPANGRWAYVDADADDFVVSTKLMVIRGRKNEIVPRFLYHFLTSSKTTKWLQHLAESRSGTFPQITFDQVAELDIALPSLNVQSQIADFLDCIENKMELIRRMNGMLEAVARTLFKSWFVDFDPVCTKAAGRDTGLPKPLSNFFPDSFDVSELRRIPKGWRAGCLGDVAAHPRRSMQPFEINPNTPYIALEHMPRRCIALSDWGIADGLGSNKFQFRKNEILFGKLRPYFHKVGVAPVDGVCSTDIVVVEPRTEDLFGFVLCCVSSDAFVEYTNAGSTGTKMPRTSWNEMARYPLSIPPDRLVKEFGAQVRPAIDRIIAGIHETRTLVGLRDALLPKLISGELRVKNAERLMEGVV